jgi:hypothetical protein
MNKKRGQVTLFIILGIVILLLIALFLAYQRQLAIFKPEPGVVVPPEVAPLKRFVENCVETTSEEGIRLIAANGGYIRFPDEINNNPFSAINSNPLFPDIKVPLWRYRGRTRIPDEDSMAADLEYYIEENLDTCLNDLTAFEGLFEINKGEIAATVELLGDGVSVELDYPLEIIQAAKNQTTKIDKFETVIPLRLKTLYGLAKQVMEKEDNDLFLELTTIDLMALDPDIPYTDIEFTCEPKTWYVEDVRNKLKHLLRTDLPLIRVEKTKFEPVPQDRPYEAQHFIWEVSSLRYPDTHVSFTYDEAWPFEFYVRPNYGPLLRSNAQQGQEILSLLCMHLWHFTYDARFPVMATVTDDVARGHDSLTFNFGIEVGVNHNQPDTANFGISSFDFEQATVDERFCSESVTNILSVHTFENVSTEEYGDLLQEIPGVNISYTCIRLRCDMGQSKLVFGNIAWLQADFPYCINGVLRGEKEGYDDSYIFVSTDQEKTVDLYLTPVVKKGIRVVKHYLIGDRIEEAEPLEEDEMAIVTLKRKNQTYSEAIYPPVEGITELKMLGKWDYTYDVNVYLMDDDGIKGGYRADWTPAWTELKDSDEIVFHVLERPYTEDPAEQYLFITNIKEDSAALPLPELR